MENKSLPKIVVICGPTASGKTDWSLHLAKKYNGEIISADSRQIFKKMSIGTAKVVGEWSWKGFRRTYFVDDIPHHLVDFLDPGKTFTVAEFRDKALKYIKMALKNRRVPIIVGGTGLYIDSIVNNFHIPKVAANSKLRASLENKTLPELVTWLQKLDPVGAKKIDLNNKRRLIRALEVTMVTGVPFSAQKKLGEKLFDVLEIGVEVPREILYNNIDKRIDQQLETGLLEEIEKLLKQKYSWDLPSMSGIGYRQFKDYFAGKATLAEAITLLKIDVKHYAKRQLTWFKRNTNIKWVKSLPEADEFVDNFLRDK
jgi:tRNA dimethylallyltransferase